jgi:hypothetical protein
MSGIYQQMSERGHPFSICIDLRKDNNPLDVNDITSFLFLPGYTRLEMQLPLSFISDDKEALESAATTTEKYLTSQGITKIRVNKILREDEDETNGYARLWSLGSLENNYQGLLNSEQYYNQSVFLHVEDKQELNDAIGILQRTEQDFREKNPRLYRLIEMMQQQAREMGSLQHQHTALEAELIYQQQHNEILRATHPAKQLQEYYNAQYEVLPTWYKRFGHVLKIITGKRKLN